MGMWNEPLNCGSDVNRYNGDVFEKEIPKVSLQKIYDILTLQTLFSKCQFDAILIYGLWEKSRPQSGASCF